jgi:hypothetical protein
MLPGKKITRQDRLRTEAQEEKKVVDKILK